MGNGDRIGLSWNIGGGGSDGNVARPRISWDVTLGACLRLLARRGGIARRRSSGKGVHWSSATIVRQQQSEKRSQQRWKDYKARPFQLKLSFSAGHRNHS